MTHEISPLAIVDGRRRDTNASLRSFRQPQTMSKPLFERRDHRRDVVRIVLQIAVRGDDEPPARVREAGGKRRGLAEVAAEPDDAQPRIASLQLRQDLETVIGAAIVDDDDFVAASPGRQRLRELAMQLGSDGASLRIGMTTVRSTAAMVNGLSALPFDSAATPAAQAGAAGAAPEQVQGEPEHEHAERLEGHPRAVVAHVGHRRLAVPHRQYAEREIADAAADGDGDREPRRR